MEHDISNLKVAKSNELIQSAHRMTRNQMILFAIAVSHIDSTKEKHPNKVTVMKEDILKIFDLKGEDKWTRLKTECKKLQSRSQVELINENGDIDWYMVIPHVTWHRKYDYVTFNFHSDLMPHLTDLKKYFTQYPIMTISQFKSLYSMRIYEYLKMLKYDSVQGNRFQEWTIGLDKLKSLLDCSDQYADFRNFDKKVLKVAEREINEHSELFVKYEKIRRGRSIRAIKFIFQNRLNGVAEGQISLIDDKIPTRKPNNEPEGEYYDWLNYDEYGRKR
jgi:plasmid replication initiation protein